MRPAGCSTERRERIVAPSFDIVTSCVSTQFYVIEIHGKGMERTPILSTSILSRPNGPRELFTIFAMVCAATTGEMQELEMSRGNRGIERTILITNVLPGNPISAQECTCPWIALKHRWRDVCGVSVQRSAKHALGLNVGRCRRVGYCYSTVTFTFSDSEFGLRGNYNENKTSQDYGLSSVPGTTMLISGMSTLR
jgi:hypothetical protein